MQIRNTQAAIAAYNAFFPHRTHAGEAVRPDIQAGLTWSAVAIDDQIERDLGLPEGSVHFMQTMVESLPDEWVELGQTSIDGFNVISDTAGKMMSGEIDPVTGMKMISHEIANMSAVLKNAIPNPDAGYTPIEDMTIDAISSEFYKYTGMDIKPVLETVSERIKERIEEHNNERQTVESRQTQERPIEQLVERWREAYLDIEKKREAAQAATEGDVVSNTPHPVMPEGIVPQESLASASNDTPQTSDTNTPSESSTMPSIETSSPADVPEQPRHESRRPEPIGAVAVPTIITPPRPEIVPNTSAPAIDLSIPDPAPAPIQEHAEIAPPAPAPEPAPAPAPAPIHVPAPAPVEIAPPAPAPPAPVVEAPAPSPAPAPPPPEANTSRFVENMTTVLENIGGIFDKPDRNSPQPSTEGSSQPVIPPGIVAE